MKKKFKLAKLVDYNGDLSKNWYIEFWFFNAEKKKLMRKRIYKNFGKLRTKKQKYDFAKTEMERINSRLKNGFFFEKKISKIDNKKTILVIVQKIWEIKKQRIRKNTQKIYNSVVNNFVKFLTKEKIETDEIKNFDKNLAIEFFDSINEKSNVYINRHLIILRNLFNEMINRNLIEINPFDKIKKLPTIHTVSRFHYSDEQIEKIKTEILAKEPRLWLFIQFIFYCYLRPNEVFQLQIKHLDFENSQVFVPSYVSKNKKDDWVQIPNQFLPELTFLKRYSPESFILNLPDTQKYSLRKYRFLYRKILNFLGFSQNYLLYSWKDTGVIKAFLSGKTTSFAYAIQRQCRHHSLEMTIKYLKSLGLLKNNEFTEIFTTKI